MAQAFWPGLLPARYGALWQSEVHQCTWCIYTKCVNNLVYLCCFTSRICASILSKVLSQLLKKDLSINYIGFFSLKNVSVQLQNSSVVSSILGEATQARFVHRQAYKSWLGVRFSFCQGLRGLDSFYNRAAVPSEWNGSLYLRRTRHPQMSITTPDITHEQKPARAAEPRSAFSNSF